MHKMKICMLMFELKGSATLFKIYKFTRYLLQRQTHLKFERQIAKYNEYINNDHNYDCITRDKFSTFIIAYVTVSAAFGNFV